MKYFTYFIIAVVTVAVITGFFIVGSPQEERLRRFDEQRVGHLQTLQYQILNYWQNKGGLPAKLSDLRDDISGFVPPVDPEKSGVEYDYRVIDEKQLKFELCADFARPSLSRMEAGYPKIARPIEPYSISENWQHDSGRVCFERAIDKEIYKPRKE